MAFDEPWWISLAAAAGDILLLTVYTDTDNPDKQSLIAYDVNAQQLIWWYNGFTLKSVSAAHVMGVDHKFPGVETLLDLFTGKPVRNVDFHLGDSQNFPVIRPFQYEEGTAHFETVRQFLLTRTARIPAARVEYLEWEGLIFLSVFVNDNGLANYLYAFDSSGNTLLEETLGVNLKGVGLDTFFIYSGHLIFVKNKNELRGYKIL